MTELETFANQNKMVMIHKDFEVEIEANIFDVKYELGFEEFPTLNLWTPAL